MDENQMPKLILIWRSSSILEEYMVGIYHNVAVLEITVGHWPFSDQFQHLADQNPFWSAKFTVHFQ